MASEPLPTKPSFDLREQAARIDSLLAGVDQALANAFKIRVEADKMRDEADKVRAETVKIERETSLAPWQVVFTELGAGAVLFAAGIAFAKLFIG